MTYREVLVQMLSEVFPRVLVKDDESFVLDAQDKHVVVHGTEADIETRARALAGDGLAALGEIQNDATGLAAGLGLLAIHIEELVGSDSTVSRIEVTSTGLRAYTSA